MYKYRGFSAKKDHGSSAARHGTRADSISFSTGMWFPESSASIPSPGNVLGDLYDLMGILVRPYRCPKGPEFC